MSFTVLSLFDGISCGQVALQNVGLTPRTYYASEINKHSIKVTQHNWPNTVQLGDICSLENPPKVDIVIGGSPCQSFSSLNVEYAGRRLEGKSGLFFEFVKILNKVQPRFFLLENVKMPLAYVDIISSELGVRPVEINTNLFLPQNRKRLYWTNIPITSLPEKECSTSLKDILEKAPNGSETIGAGRLKWLQSEGGQKRLAKRYAALDSEKAICLTARGDASWVGNYVTRNGKITRLTPVEWERLQGLPDNYTASVANCHRYKALGDCWSIPVIEHIFKGLPQEWRKV